MFYVFTETTKNAEAANDMTHTTPTKQTNNFLLREGIPRRLCSEIIFKIHYLEEVIV